MSLVLNVSVVPSCFDSSTAINGPRVPLGSTPLSSININLVEAPTKSPRRSAWNELNVLPSTIP
jgi:hypothetical protein